MTLQELEQKAKSFKVSGKQIEETVSRLESFLREWPFKRTNDLTLDDYLGTVGNTQDSFIYWLERKKVMAGIGGGNASKFGIYMSQQGEFKSGFGIGQRILTRKEAELEFQTIKNEILTSLEAIEKGDWDFFLNRNYSMWHMVMNKILIIYHPDLFLNIAAFKELESLSLDLGIDRNLIKNENSIYLNYLCNLKLHDQEAFKEWHWEKLSQFIWELYSDLSRRDYYILGSKYGGNTDMFPEMYRSSVVSVAFAQDYNLSDLLGESQKNIKKWLEEKGEAQNSINALKYFLNLKVGDRVAVKSDGSPKGKKPFLAIRGIAELIEKEGEVYRYDPKGLGHTMNVKWIIAPINEEYAIGGYGATIHKLSKPEQIKEIFEGKYNVVPIKDGIGSDKNHTIGIPLELNTILYGPPGTGKTFKLKNDYFDLFTTKEATKTKEDFINEQVNELPWWQVIGLIVLDLESCRVPEMFKHPILQAKSNQSTTKTPKNTIWSQLQLHTKSDCSHVNLTRRSEPQIFWKDEKGMWSIDKKIVELEIPELIEILDSINDYLPESSEKKRYLFTTFHQSYGYEDFMEGIKPVMMEDAEEEEELGYRIEDGIFKKIVKMAKDDPQNPYALFIDEINRGNVANIFGELITLIEADKREGAKHPMSVELPYSKKSFSVPKNLYIIGTMNTADRSIEALDTALRRRFSFNRFEPDIEILQNHSDLKVDLKEMLRVINLRIEKLLDKDHVIGHAYLMDISDAKNPFEKLKKAFANQILPLLEEYFYGDPEKIMSILGSGFIEKQKDKEVPWPKEARPDDLELKEVYKIKNPLLFEDESPFLEIYEE